VIHLSAGTRIWLVAGVTDMRRGFNGLSAQVQTVLEQEPFSGHMFLFRGRGVPVLQCTRESARTGQGESRWHGIVIRRSRFTTGSIVPDKQGARIA